MKIALRITTLWAAALLAPAALSAADETVSGTLTVQQDLLVHQTIEVGQATLGSVEYPVYTLQANSALGSTSIDQMAYGTVSSWHWSTNDGTGSRKIMLLGNDGKLSLYSSADAATPVIIINAGGTAPGITIAGKQVLTHGSLKNVLVSSEIGNGAVALGLNAQSFSSSAVAIGYYASASSIYSVAVGDDSFSSSGSTSVGHGAKASGSSSSALGATASAAGENSIALGTSTSARGKGSTAVGAEASASANGAVALGFGAFARQPYQITLGSFNIPEDNAHFIIGNGTRENWNYKPSNLFVIMKDGRGVFRSTSYVDSETPVAPQAKEALTVEGAATIKGTLRVRPAGDLPMGIFTAGGQP